MTRSLLWVLGAALGLAGCSSTGVGNPGVISFAIVADNDDSDAGTGAGGDSSLGGGESAGAAGVVDSDEALPEAAIFHAYVVLGYPF